jgi:hypothetical protein
MTVRNSTKRGFKIGEEFSFPLALRFYVSETIANRETYPAQPAPSLSLAWPPSRTMRGEGAGSRRRVFVARSADAIIDHAPAGDVPGA